LKKDLNLNLSNKDALIIADIQNDFLLGGALPVPKGDEIILVLNEYAKIFSKTKAKIIASRDWHPSNHISFTAQGGRWQPHCVQETEGANFHPDLKLPKGTEIISKATDLAKEAYSVFEGTGLAEALKSQGVTRVFVGGLATDYCVVNTVLDALKLGYEAVLLADATRGINVKLGDVERAIELMLKSGAKQVTLTDFPEPEALPDDVNAGEATTDKPLSAIELKKKARMRAKGAYKQVRREHG
jgi:nicotinamidase/pyrazinamidase